MLYFILFFSIKRSKLLFLKHFIKLLSLTKRTQKRLTSTGNGKNKINNNNNNNNKQSEIIQPRMLPHTVSDVYGGQCIS